MQEFEPINWEFYVTKRNTQWKKGETIEELKENSLPDEGESTKTEEKKEEEKKEAPKDEPREEAKVVEAINSNFNAGDYCDEIPPELLYDEPPKKVEAVEKKEEDEEENEDPADKVRAKLEEK